MCEGVGLEGIVCGVEGIGCGRHWMRAVPRAWEGVGSRVQRKRRCWIMLPSSKLLFTIICHRLEMGKCDVLSISFLFRNSKWYRMVLTIYFDEIAKPRVPLHIVRAILRRTAPFDGETVNEILKGTVPLC